MIKQVRFQNFKALRDVSLRLDRLTVFVGPNASGKTSVLEGIHYLSELGRKRSHDASERWRIPLRLRTSGTQSDMILWCSGRDGELRLSIGNHGCEYVGESRAGGEKEEYFPEDEAYGPDELVPIPSVDIPFDFGPAVFLRPDIARLVASSYSEEPIPSMEGDGYGLPSVLLYMVSSQPREYEQILTDLRSIVPAVEGMRFPRAKVIREVSELMTVDGKEFSHRGEREYWGNCIEFDMLGAPEVPASMMSEGTLLVLGLLTALSGPTPPRVALLDDLDRALHPRAQKDLVGLLRKVLDQNPDMQIVGTSHSPYLLDHLLPEEIRITTLKDDGSVAIGRLDEHPEFEKWKEEMSPGEFWSLVGEQWVAKAGAGGKA